MTAAQGVPYTVFCGASFAAGCDYNANGAGYDRPNVPTFGDSMDGSNNDDYLTGIFKASDFPTPAPGVPGVLGRNTYRGPRYFNVDVFVIKLEIPVGGQFSGRAVPDRGFNLFNTTNLDLPVGNLSDPLFGRSVSAAPSSE